MRVTTCVPKQFNTFDEKWNWLVEAIDKEKSDIFVTPQEYFGGDYIMPQKRAFTKAELLPKLEQLSKDKNVGLIVGLIEDENGVFSEKIWFIDKELKGEIKKMAEPAYTLAGVGTYGLVPETDFDKRWVNFEIKGAIVSGFFCWEVFSDFLFAGLGMLDVDMVFSLIKFGVAASPKKDESGALIKIGGFNFFKDSIWKRRIEMANEFEVKCPIVISTNSWNLPAKAEHLYGVQDIFTERTMKIATENDIQNGVCLTEEIDLEKTRGNREHWSSYLERNGEMPPGFLMKYTMMWKIYNLERRLMGKSADHLKFEFIQKMLRSRKIYNKKKTKGYKPR